MSYRLPIIFVFLLALSGRAPAAIMWGVNGHPFNTYRGVSIERQLDYLVDLGLKSYRVNIASVAEAPKLAELVAAAKPRGIEILPVSLDGGTLPEFPHPKTDTQVASELGVSTVPSLFLVDPQNRNVIPLGSGVMSADELADRIYVLTQTEPGKDY